MSSSINKEDKKNLRIALVAGEKSGDKLGGDLILSLKKIFPNAKFLGVGGEEMIAAGMESFFDMEKISVMGIIEPLLNIFELLSLRKRLKEFLVEQNPDIFIGIDAPDFNLPISKLSSCYLGISCKQRYGGWAISATDGMSVGVPYMFSDDGYYHELADSAGIYYKDEDEFYTKINNILDDDSDREYWSGKSLERFEQGKWETAIHQFNDMLNETIDKLPTLKNDTDSYKRIIKFIRKKKSASKSDILDYLNWGVRISFTGYRNRLRNEKTIKFTKNRYEVI